MIEVIDSSMSDTLMDVFLAMLAKRECTQHFLTEITQPCVHTCNGLFICQLYSLPNLLEEMDCKEDTPLMLPFCIIRFPLTVDNSDMN
jgi:hypothetical protein